MTNLHLRNIIDECVRKVLNEGVFDKTATPYISKADVRRDIGVNPLRTDVGGHAAHDEVRQVSTIDWNGAGFDGKHIVVSDNKFMIYKIKNFGNPDVKDTLQFFGNTKELRRAIDTLNGAARRNNKTLFYRTITSESGKNNSERSDYMVKTFWEFSFDGNEWYILKPNPVQSPKISKFSR